MRVAPPKGYLTPTPGEIREQAKATGLKKWSPDFAAALANLAAGGEIIPVSDREPAIRDEAMKVVVPAHGGFRCPGGYLDQDFSAAVSAAAENIGRRETAIADFLRAVDFVSVPGDTPLAQACNYLKALASAEGQAAGGDGESLPIFSESEASQAAEAVNEAFESVDALSKEECELLDEAAADTSKTTPSEDGDLQAKMTLACKLADKANRVMLDLARNLDKVAKLRVTRSNKVVPDPEGDDVRRRPLRDLSEIGRIAQHEWALPRALLMYRAVTGQLTVRERVVREEKRQLMFLIIDCSGSMDEGSRIAQAAGVLFNRLEAVLREECDLRVAFFDSKLRKETQVNPAEARSYLADFSSRGNFSGGSTSIETAVKQAHERIEQILAESPGLDRPEILVVTDGDDTVHAAVAPVGTKVHAFVVGGGKNPGLCGLVEKTGGVYLEV